MEKKILQAKIDLLQLADTSPLSQAVCDILSDLLQMVQEPKKQQLGFGGKDKHDGPDSTAN